MAALPITDSMADSDWGRWGSFEAVSVTDPVVVCDGRCSAGVDVLPVTDPVVVCDERCSAPCPAPPILPYNFTITSMYRGSTIMINQCVKAGTSSYDFQFGSL